MEPRQPAADAFLPCTDPLAVAWWVQRQKSTGSSTVVECRIIPVDAPVLWWEMLFPHLFQDGWGYQWAFPVDARCERLSYTPVHVPRPEGWVSRPPPSLP